MKKILGVYTSPRRHWVGDGFPVRSFFSYNRQGQHLLSAIRSHGLKLVAAGRTPTAISRAMAVSLLLLSASSQSGGIPVGAELVSAGTPYSPGILSGDTLYVAALQGTDPKTHVLSGDFGQETRNCIENLGRVLKDVHMNYSDVASVQIYLDDMSQFKQVNAIYLEYFKRPLPARTTVQVTKLSLGAHIEISAIAHH
jgi:2-iminobutanoate/2-iminopropanoate deaminase